jgi:hypothetical protein
VIADQRDAGSGEAVQMKVALEADAQGRLPKLPHLKGIPRKLMNPSPTPVGKLAGLIPVASRDAA